MLARMINNRNTQRKSISRFNNFKYSLTFSKKIEDIDTL